MTSDNTDPETEPVQKRRGRAATPEAEAERRRKISEALKREPHGWAAPGYRPSEEKKAAIRNGLRRYWASPAGRARAERLRARMVGTVPAEEDPEPTEDAERRLAAAEQERDDG